jgi:hypothetical protein
MAPHSTSRQLDEHTLPYMSYSQAHPFYAKSLYPAFRGVLNHWKWTASPAPHTTQVLARVSASDDVVFRRERRRFSIRRRLAGPESHWGHFRLGASLAVGNCRAWRQMGILPMARSHRHSPVQTISLTASSLYARRRLNTDLDSIRAAPLPSLSPNARSCHAVLSAL